MQPGRCLALPSRVLFTSTPIHKPCKGCMKSRGGCPPRPLIAHHMARCVAGRNEATLRSIYDDYALQLPDPLEESQADMEMAFEKHVVCHLDNTVPMDTLTSTTMETKHLSAHPILPQVSLRWNMFGVSLLHNTSLNWIASPSIKHTPRIPRRMSKRTCMLSRSAVHHNTCLWVAPGSLR